MKRKFLELIIFSIAMLPQLLPAQGIRIKPGSYLKVPSENQLHENKNIVAEDNKGFHTHGTVKIHGNIVNQNPDPMILDTGKLIFEGNFSQIISGEVQFDHLIINNPTEISLTNDIKVNHELSMTDGLLILGNNNLMMGPIALISGNPSANSMVIATGSGKVLKEFSAPGSFTFPVGDSTGTPDYSPVTLTFTGGTFGGDNWVGINLVNSKYPDPNIQNDYLNRYWNVIYNNISGFSCNAQFNYTQEDIVGNETNLYCLKTNPSPYTAYNPANTVNHILTASGLTEFGSYTGGGAPCYNLQVNAAVVSNVSCFGGSNGSATANVFGANGPVTYLWSTIPAQTSQTATGLTFGTYTVTVNDMLSCSSQSTVTITQPPQWWPGLNGITSLCVNSGYYQYTTEAGMSNYSWAVSSGGIIEWGEATNEITVTWNLPGTHSVTVNYINGNGCIAFSPTTISVNVLPMPGNAGNITGTPSLCGGTKGVAYSTSPVANAVNYVWTFPAGATIVGGAGTTDITVDFDTNSASGNIFACGNNLCGNGSNSPPFQITVKQVPPKPIVTLEGVIMTSNASYGNQWYFWPDPYGAGIPIPGATDSMYIATQNGFYWTSVSQNGCTSDSSIHLHVLVVNLEEPERSRFVIYPVPNEGIFTLMMNCRTLEIFSIRIYNMLGTLIYKEEGVPVVGKMMKAIDLRPTSTGVYSVVIQNSHHRIFRKVMISK